MKHAISFSGLLLAGLLSSSASMGKTSTADKTRLLGRDTTSEIIVARQRLDQAGPGQRSARLAALQAAASDRKQAMLLLMEHDPGAALRMALPAAIQEQFPVEAAQYLERQVNAEGTLEVFFADMFDAKTSKTQYVLRTKKSRINLHFAGNPNRTWQSGDHIRVKGVQLDQELAASPKDTQVTAQRAPAQSIYPNTLGAQKTLVVLINFSDLPNERPFTPEQASQIAFTDASRFDMENSYQQTSLQGKVTPWLVIPMLSTAACNPNNIGDAADQAATAAGFVKSDYQRFVYVFPANTCGWWGLGAMGGLPSRAWIQARGGFNTQAIAHEMGHNFGLYHSHSLDCGTAPVGSGECVGNDYGDSLDVMGWGPVGTAPHYNAAQKSFLGWLGAGNSPPITSVGSNGGNFRIGNTEAPRSTVPRALKIDAGSTCGINAATYYVEKRDAVGFDSYLSDHPNVTNGVVIHRVVKGGVDTFLLDMTPETTSRLDAALEAGKTFTDPSSGITITTSAVAPGSADVSVGKVPATCVRGRPLLTVTPTSLWTAPGADAQFTASITNRDSCACAPTSFSLSAFVPTGWTMTPGTSAQLAPGQTGTAITKVSSPASAPLGVNNINVRATNASYAPSLATALVTVGLTRDLKVTASATSWSYTRPKGGKVVKVPITAIVSSYAGAPSQAANVVFSIKTPTGAIVSLSAITNSAGSATVNYPVSATSSYGAYETTVSVNQGGLSGSGTVTFVVN